MPEHRRCRSSVFMTNMFWVTGFMVGSEDVNASGVSPDWDMMSSYISSNSGVMDDSSVKVGVIFSRISSSGLFGAAL